MNHLTEEQLILFHYGEADGRDESAAHLRACPECRAELDRIEQTLELADEAFEIPERGEAYGAEVWARIAPKLDEAKKPARVVEFPMRRWMAVGAVAAVAVLAYMAGRFHASAPPPTTVAGAISEPARERILMSAVGDHLDRSQSVLVELANTRPTGQVSLVSERARAEDLLESNRLYRQAALRSGNQRMASILDELERTLIEIAHSPETLDSPEYDALRRRIEEQGIVFKVRVAGSEIRQREIKPIPGERF